MAWTRADLDDGLLPVVSPGILYAAVHCGHRAVGSGWPKRLIRLLNGKMKAERTSRNGERCRLRLRVMAWSVPAMDESSRTVMAMKR